MSTQAVLKLHLLGSLSIGQDGAAVGAIESDKARALLVYLALEADHAHSRQSLAALFWPDADERTGLRNLRQALYSVRRATGDPSADQPYLSPTRQAIQFDASAPHQIDAVVFAGYIETVKRHPHIRLTSCAACVNLLERAAELYRGDFLAGFSLPDCDEFEIWLQGRRDKLRGQALDALASLAAHHAHRRDYEQAELYYRRQVEIAPWHEEAHRGIMTMLALRGQKAAAIHHYSVLQAAVATEFGADPLPESRALLEKIQAGQLQPEAEELANPYKGLLPFDQHDADRFFGREVVIQQLVDLLRAQPFCAVIGASGSGKSSLIHAGLLPTLGVGDLRLRSDASAVAPDAGEWVSVSIRPGSAPFMALAAALAPHLLLTSEIATETLAEQLRSGETNLWTIAQGITQRQIPARRRHRSAPRILLVIDQFEELYTLCPDAAERQSFIDMLLAPSAQQAPNTAATIPPGVLRVLVLLRADFTGQAISYRPLADAIQQGGLVLGPMNGDELRRAIVEPARRQGVTFESGLVERLLKDIANEPGNLLLIQFALTLLWEKRKNGMLTHVDYEETGGVVGALAHYADGVVGAMDASEREGVRRLFLRLVQPGDDAPDTRRMVARAALGAEDWRLVQRLADARLLVTDRRDEQEVAEVAHEALIRNWGRLRSWLDADRQFHRWQFQLQDAAERWSESGNDPSLLLRGAQLIQAETWLDERGKELSPFESSFIAVAIDERDRLNKEQEEQRQVALAQAQNLARIEHDRADAEARSTKRLRLLSGILAFSLLAVLVITFIAWSLARESQRQTQLATAAQQIAEEARIQAQVQAELADAQTKLAEEQKTLAENETQTAKKERSRAEEQARLAEEEHKRAEMAAQRALSRQLGAQAQSRMSDQLDLGLLLAVESARLATPADKVDLLLNLNISPLAKYLLHAETTPVHQAEFHPPNTLVTSAEGSVRLWDMDMGKSIKQTITLAGTQFAAISPDGHRAATVDGANLTLWNVPDGQPIAPAFADHPDVIDFLTFSVDGSRLVSGSRDGTLILRDAVSGQVLKQLKYDGSGGMALGPGGEMLAMFDDFAGQSGLELRDLTTGQQIAGPVFGHSGAIQSINYSRDGSLLVTAGADKTLRLWDGKTLAPIGQPFVGHSARVLIGAISPDNKTLASGGADNHIILWDIASGQAIGQPLTGHSNWVRDVTFSPDGRTLASTDAGGGIALWDLGAHQTLRGHSDNVRAIALTPDDETLITSSYDRTMRWWDAITGEVQAAITTPHQSSIITMAISPDGKTAATADVDGLVALWDVKARALLFPALQGNPSVIVSLAFSPDGKTLASGDFDGTITLWDVESGRQLLKPFKAHEGWTLSLAFSPDGEQLASGSQDAEIRLWKLPSSRTPSADPLPAIGQPMKGHSNWVTSLLFWPDGKRLVSGSGDHTVRQWDLASQQAVAAPLTGHAGYVWGLQVYPTEAAGGGKALAALDNTGAVLFWDLDAGIPLGPPLHTFTETETQVISADGRRLYQGAFNSAVEVWELPGLVWESRACAIANRNLTKTEWERFLPDLPYREMCE